MNKLWALLYHNTDEYSLPEVLAVSESQKELRALAVEDAAETFGEEYVEARMWQSDGEPAGGVPDVASSFDNDLGASEYFIVEVTYGMVI